MSKGVEGYINDKSSYWAYMRVSYTQTYYEETNTSTFHINSIQMKSEEYYGQGWYVDGRIKVNGEQAVWLNGKYGGGYTVNVPRTGSWYTVGGSSGSVTVKHDIDGNAKVRVTTSGNNYGGFEFIDSSHGHGFSMVIDTTITLTKIPSRTLRIFTGEGSVISVKRTSSGSYPTGMLSDGSVIRKGDKLRVTYSPLENYKVLSCTINDGEFTSGGTYTVSGDTTIRTFTQILASSVIASDATIGSVSNITINMYGKAYTHTLSYNLKGTTGIIADRIKDLSFQWVIPNSFYALMPNSTSEKCVITCSTYDGDSLLGSNSTTINIFTSREDSSPKISYDARIIDDKTLNLTGSSSTVLRYVSTVECSFVAEPQFGSTIVTKRLNDISMERDGVFLNKATIYNADVKDISFYAKDSRGYDAYGSKSFLFIPYIPITIQPIIKRPAEGENVVTIEFSGNFYNGSLGRYDNIMEVLFRYKESSQSIYSSWEKIPKDAYQIGSASFGTTSPFVIPHVIDYKKSYDFQIRAVDGASNIILSDTTYDTYLKKGEPVFDWGESDFKFNVPVNIVGSVTASGDISSGSNISASGSVTASNGSISGDLSVGGTVTIGGSVLNGLIAYPVGSIYMSINATSPAELFGGSWEALKNCFLFAADDSTEAYMAGATGGEFNHKLVEKELPVIDGSWATGVVGRHGERGVTGHAYGTSFPNIKDAYDSTSANTQWGYGYKFGGGKPHNNMPPYLAVYMWKRIS